MSLALASGPQEVAELVLWAVPMVLAWRASRRDAGSRGAWRLVAGACAFICADKGLDLHGVVMDWIRDAARTFAPELRSTGSAQGARSLLLGIGGLLAGLVLWLLARRLGLPSWPVRVSLLGLTVVIGLLAARLTGPGRALGDESLPGLGVQLAGWALVSAGPLLARARRSAPAPGASEDA